MAESRRQALIETGIVLTGQVVCTALMLGVYGLIGAFSTKVLLGGIAGALLASGNFFFMAVIATLAADKAEKQDVEGGKKLIKSSYPIRLLVLTVILIALAKSGWVDLIALVLPLVFTRPILMVAEFFRKKGA